MGWGEWEGEWYASKSSSAILRHIPLTTNVATEIKLGLSQCKVFDRTTTTFCATKLASNTASLAGIGPGDSGSPVVDKSGHEFLLQGITVSYYDFSYTSYKEKKNTRVSIFLNFNKKKYRQFFCVVLNICLDADESIIPYIDE